MKKNKRHYEGEAKRAIIAEKGVVNNAISSRMFSLLESRGIRT